MKAVLRQLLEAEEAGRQAAAQLEAAGAELLSQARRETEQIRQRARADAARQQQAREEESRAAAERGRQAIADEAEATLRHLQGVAARRRQEAVARVVAILLGEQDA